jgi:hypothetical protein
MKGLCLASVRIKRSVVDTLKTIEKPYDIIQSAAAVN